MNNTIKFCTTIGESYVPGYVDIEFALVESFINSLEKNETGFSLDVAGHALSKEQVACLEERNIARFSAIEKDRWIDRANYFCAENMLRVIRETDNELVCAIDIDIIVSKKIEIERDFDIGLTIRSIWLSEHQAVNAGVIFFNVTPENKKDIEEFMVIALDKIPQLVVPGTKEVNYEMDRMGLQTYLCNLAHQQKWIEPGLYQYNGLKIRLLDHRYNYAIQEKGGLLPEVFIYHIKGTRVPKLERIKNIFPEFFPEKRMS